MEKEETLIEVRNLIYQKLINNISLNIKKGTITTISGTNSCGKTTLIKIIGGIIPTQESIYIENEEIEKIHKTELYKKLSIILPEEEIKEKFQSIKEEMLTTISNIYDDKAIVKKQYNEIIEITKTKRIQEKSVDTLSNVDKVKYKIAISLTTNPQILLIDEILKTLTSKEKKEIEEILINLKENKNITIIMTTKDLSDSIISDYIYIIDFGKIILEGKPLEVLTKDNEINKLGLDIPFMIDLSVKLSDYEILNSIILDNDRMIEKLWK